MSPDNLPSIQSVACESVPDNALPLLNALVSIRAQQLVDAALPDLTLEDAHLYHLAHALAAAAYRQGLRDGVVKVGELVG